MAKIKEIRGRVSDTEFEYVPKEVKEKIGTGIFWPAFTHVTGTCNRDGIAKTGKLMSPSVALTNGIVSFSGEYLPFTFLFRMYNISLSRYPKLEHSWHWYTGYSKVFWTPEKSERFINQMREEIEEIKKKPMDYSHFSNPSIRRDNIISLEENIRFENERQRTYNKMSADEREKLNHSKPDIYLFGDNLNVIWKMRDPHPYRVSDINLQKYLIGIFTADDLKQTKEWSSSFTGKNIHVASIDALATWETMFRKLLSYEDHKPYDESFFFKLRLQNNEDLRQRVIKEVKEMR